MKLSEFDSKHTEYEIEGTGITSRTKKANTWTNKINSEISFTIPINATVKVYFSPKKYPGTIFVQYENEVKTSKTFNAHRWLTGFQKPPSIKTLEKRSFDGISKSVTGRRVEPDGFGEDGSPAWELVVGII